MDKINLNINLGATGGGGGGTGVAPDGSVDLSKYAKKTDLTATANAIKGSTVQAISLSDHSDGAPFAVGNVFEVFYTDEYGAKQRPHHHVYDRNVEDFDSQTFRYDCFSHRSYGIYKNVDTYSILKIDGDTATLLGYSWWGGLMAPDFSDVEEILGADFEYWHKHIANIIGDNYVEDVPNDHKIYGRKDGVWEEIGAGGMTDEALINYGEGGFVGTGTNAHIGGKSVLTETMDIDGDWYVEYVINNNPPSKGQAYYCGVDAPSSFSSWAITAAASYIRTNNGNGQYKNNTVFNITGISRKGWHHFLFVHRRYEGGINVFMYVDGVLIASETDSNTYTPTTKWGRAFGVGTMFDFKMFRCGYFDGDVEKLVTTHFNGNNPFAVENVGDIIVEILPNNIFTDHAINTATGLSMPISTNVEILEDNPWANPIKAEGEPVNVPLYKGQHYLDTLTNTMYEAKGNTQVTDWEKKGNPTFDDLDNLKEEIIEIGDRRWSGGGSGGGGTAIVVTDYYKDGITEDSDAIEAAIEEAKSFGKVLYFPKGIYKLKRSIQLWNNAVIDGDKGSVLTHKAVDGNGCIMTTLASATAIGDTTISVSSVAGLNVGDEIVICNTTSGSYQETMCKIMAINGNVLTIDATEWHGSAGVRMAYPTGSTHITTDFALIHTHWVNGANNCVIKNITIQANGNNNEPYIYSQSPIHIHRDKAYDISIEDVIIDGSVNDGISIQGSAKQRVIGCTVKGVKWKGVHWGTTSADVLVERCWFSDCGKVATTGNNNNWGGGAIYSCYNNHRLRVINNYITDCLRGVFGFDYREGADGTDESFIISGNIINAPKCIGDFGGIGIYISGARWGSVIGNNFSNFGKNSTPIFVNNEDGRTIAVTIADNTIGCWASDYVGNSDCGALCVKGASNIVVTGNNISNLTHGSHEAPYTPITGYANLIVDGCAKCIVTSNIVAGGKVEEKNTNTDCVIASNVVDLQSNS